MSKKKKWVNMKITNYRDLQIEKSRADQSKQILTVLEYGGL